MKGGGGGDWDIRRSREFGITEHEFEVFYVLKQSDEVRNLAVRTIGRFQGERSNGH